VAAAKPAEPGQGSFETPASASAYASPDNAAIEPSAATNARWVLQRAVRGGGRLSLIMTPRKAFFKKSKAAGAATTAAAASQKVLPIPENASVNSTPPGRGR
jgi:hypothetical protein